MPSFEDLTGLRFGRLTVVKRKFVLPKTTHWLVRCDCGKDKTVMAGNLKKGTTTSCGCFGTEQRTKRQTTHGKKWAPEYTTWQSMKDRCLNIKNKSFKYYGGRGITICEKWVSSFENFYNDMGDKPSPKHSIDRIKNSGNYEPGNCKWSTMKEQNNNKLR